MRGWRGAWLLLLLLVAAIVFVEATGLLGPRQRRDEHGHILKAAVMLLPVAIEQAGAIEVEEDGAAVRFERGADGAWTWRFAGDGHGAGGHSHGGDGHGHSHGGDGHGHSHGDDGGDGGGGGAPNSPETAALIERALGAFGRARVQREIGRGAPGAEYGVLTPEMTVRVYLPGARRPVARYLMGDVAADRLSRYVLAGASLSIVTIPEYQVENLRQLAAAVTGRPRAPAEPPGGAHSHPHPHKH